MAWLRRPWGKRTLGKRIWEGGVYGWEMTMNCACCGDRVPLMQLWQSRTDLPPWCVACVLVLIFDYESKQPGPVDEDLT